MRMVSSARAFVVVALAFPVGAAAQDQPKYQIEARVMVWADVSGRQSVAGQTGTITDFMVRRARLAIQGTPAKSINFSLQIGEDNLGAKVLTPDASIRFKDAYITYRAHDALQFTAGQFKIPFLRINLESGFNQLLVDRGTLPSLRPAREGSRDLGLMTWGNANRFQYRAALFDGSDQDARNASSSVRVSTRLAYNWFAKESGLGYTGTYLGATRVLQVAGNIDVQNRRLDPRDQAAFQSRPRDYRAYALEAFFEQPLAGSSAVTIDGAWVYRSDDYLEPGLSQRTQQGYYGQAAYLLPGRVGPGRLQFAFRQEDWDDERGAVHLDITRTTGGATYYVKGHAQKVQADFTHKRETPEIVNDEFRLSLVLVF